MVFHSNLFPRSQVSSEKRQTRNRRISGITVMNASYGFDISPPPTSTSLRVGAKQQYTTKHNRSLERREGVKRACVMYRGKGICLAIHSFLPANYLLTSIILFL